jgi:urate oxidase
MESIKNIIEKVFADKNIQYKNISIYDKILGVLRRYIPKIEEINLNQNNNKNILEIEIESAVYRNEIQMRKSQILRDLDSLDLGDLKIKDIKILIKGRRY